MSSKNRHRERHGRIIETNETSPIFDEYDRISTCSSKNAYDTEWQAQFVIDETEKRDGTVLSMYQCPYCNKWHLTSN